MRIIPRKTRVKMEFFRGVTLTDILVGLVLAASVLGLFLANFDFHIWVALGWLSICIALFFPVADGVKMYATLGYLFRFFAQAKRFSKEKKKRYAPMNQIIPFEGILQDRFIDFKDYYAQVLEITPLEFGLLNEYKQNMLIETFANALRRLGNDQTCSIIKESKAMIFDNYIYMEDKKYDSLMEMRYDGEFKPEEVDARAGVFEGRVSQVEYMNRQEKTYKDYFYVVVFDKDREGLETTIQGMQSTLQTGATPMKTKLLTGRDLTVFMRANYGKEFDERELDGIPMTEYTDWATPDTIKFKAASTIINGKPYRQFAITDYPLQVPNAWGAPFFLLDRTKVNMKINPVPKEEAEKKIDKAIIEMETKFQYSAKRSRVIENQTHLETLKELLTSLKNNNQQLYEVNIYVTCEESARKEVRAILKQEGFRFSEMFGRQVDAFISSNISRYDVCKENLRGIPTSSLAAVFPFISGALQDERGFYIGYNEYPVFVDFFQRDTVRVNSNMMIIGKSGSGKSYATKTLLANLAADNTKIFILDPEDEYTQLAQNLHGKVIDVGSSAMGIINPFHIMTTLKDDSLVINGVEVADSSSDSYSTHLQFLEQFFKVILEGIDSDAFEALNSLIVDVYAEKGINSNTKLDSLSPEDYPIFDDLYRLICKKVETEKNEYHKRNYLTIQTYIKKFATGGRNSNLWNGPTSIETKENFISFNFRSLLANRNETIANAQMLLVFKYLDNEIIKNKDYNDKKQKQAEEQGEDFNKILFKNRKVIVCVDEAHVFINPNYPIALDFMAQMAKRIRKYSGMQIVITQNIKDFVGSPEIQRQSTAVINASQYSFIFSLAPNDMNDLVELYRKSGEINESEQNTIISAGIGNAFFISGPMNRTMVQIVANDYVKRLFGK